MKMNLLSYVLFIIIVSQLFFELFTFQPFSFLYLKKPKIQQKEKKTFAKIIQVFILQNVMELFQINGIFHLYMSL